MESRDPPSIRKLGADQREFQNLVVDLNFMFVLVSDLYQCNSHQEATEWLSKDLGVCCLPILHPQAFYIFYRWQAKHAGIFTAELRWTLIADPKRNIRGIC